ncbi:MAG: hypothetical protein JW994_08020 [Candidatus Omnitrophica bacterium]|nr:hypothetical protein [Candidatus Omnitrophota bacterium]
MKSKIISKIIYTAYAVFICAFFTGCVGVTEDGLKGILEKDSSFSRMLEAKKRVNAKIAALKDEYKKEKESLDQKMRSLKTDLQAKKDSLDERISSLKSEIEPEIKLLKEKLSERVSDYRSKSQNLKDSLSKLDNIEKLLNRKEGLSLSGDEISIWNKRAADLNREISFIRQSLDELKEKIRILKTEIKVLSD